MGGPLQDIKEVQKNDSEKHAETSSNPENSITIQEEPIPSFEKTGSSYDAPWGNEGIDDFPDGGLKAWLNVLGALCTTMSTFGFVNSYGIFQAYYSETLMPNVSPSSLSWIGSVQYSLTFLPGLVTGRLFDLGYFQPIMLIFSVLMIVFTFLTGLCRTYWQFLLCQGFAIGLCTGVLFGPILSCVAHWFKKRRSTAFGVVACGSSIGGTVYPILVRNLLPAVGFAWTMRILGFTLMFFLSIANLTLHRRLPPKNVAGGLFNFAMFKNPAYSCFVASGFATFLGLYTVLTYIASSATFYGVSENLAFYLVAIANASSGVGRIGSGVAADYVGAINGIVPMSLLAGVLTMVWPYAKTPSSLILVAVFYGFASGAFVSLLGIPVANMGEVADVGRRQGMLFTVLAFGAVAGPPISGQIITATNGYTSVGFYAGSMVFLGVALMVVTRTIITGRLYGGNA